MDKFSDHLFAAVDPQHQHQGIKWLRISPHNDGVGILLYEDIETRCKWDAWEDNLEAAKEFCKRNYGVELKDWISAHEMIKMGIRITDERK